MTALEVIDAYLAARRAVGVRLARDAGVLHQFVREMGIVRLSDVTPDTVATFLRGRGALSSTWTMKHGALTGLFRFAIARGYVGRSPLPAYPPKLPPRQTPYVYSNSELQRLLDATDTLHVRHSRLQAATYRMLLLLLYSTGLRVGEAIGLEIGDVDLAQRVITVRNAKFYKTRLVPVGPRLGDELAAHLERRGTLAMPQGSGSAFLCSRTGHRLTYEHVITLFQRVRSAARITCPPGELRPPRLHDLRHTAAVHRVLAWYRAGENVQRLLPHLATYLGHANIESTQRYLQMTPELLQHACRRFAVYAQQEVAYD